MRRLLLLVALGICACNREPQESAAAPTQVAPGEVIETPVAQSKAPLVVPLPKDQAELDRGGLHAPWKSPPSARREELPARPGKRSRHVRSG
jgi:hypothetical protein